MSRNGGPIAFLQKDNTIIKNKDDTENTIFIFSSYGNLITDINLKDLFKEKLNHNLPDNPT